MPPILHDAQYRASLRARLQALRPDAPRRWGRMHVDQMLWHLNRGLDIALGRVQPEPARAPLPTPLLRFVVLTLPWPRQVPTMPDMVARERHEFEAERQRCLALLEHVAATDLDDEWPTHPMLGRMRGEHWSTLQAKHLDHHLSQFGC